MKTYKLPQEIVSNIDFNKIFDLYPKGDNKVIIYDRENKEHREKTIFRGYMCYLNTPEFDNKIEKSYMFLNKVENVPEILQPFVDFVRSMDERYNQMVVNWYNPEDYIEFHRDCTAHMIDKDSPILCINLNESDNLYKVRSLLLKKVDNDLMTSIPLVNNSFYIINNNTTHRHAVGAGSEKRISITFRMLKETDEREQAR